MSAAATTAPDPIIRGWFAIAAELSVSEKTARKLAQWGRECRCPVFEDYIGPFARVSELQRWKVDQILPVGVRSRMRARQVLVRSRPARKRAKA